MINTESTSAEEVARVLAGLEAASCSAWIEGGWGVDALVGRQTRQHRDLDLDIDADHEARVLAALTDLGYAIETDRRPTRVELVAPAAAGSICIPWSSTTPATARSAGPAARATSIPRTP